MHPKISILKNQSSFFNDSRQDYYSSVALPKEYRLRQREDFSAVYKSGSRYSTPHLTLRALPSSVKKSVGVQLGSSAYRELPIQIGVSISQKVSKRAVVRNRIKRQIQGAFWQLLPDLTSGWKLVVVVKPSATQCDYEQFLQELKQLLINAEVFNGH